MSTVDSFRCPGRSLLSADMVRCDYRLGVSYARWLVDMNIKTC